jgi:genome maintenance exonuclease 1|tara:strand:- start:4464 stop:5141 length:678 start_codon:yes stop_codon:yes gene_type:complete
MFEHMKDIKLTEMNAVTTESGRQYKTPEGINYPSITTVLSILSRDGIAAWRKKVGNAEANRISYRASTRGTAVHEILEKYIDNEPDFKKGYTPDIIQSFLAVKDILDTRIGKVYAQEAPLYSNHLGIAGRVDCVAEFDGKLSIIDFKTSMKKKPTKFVTNYFMQESGYAVMWEERTGMPITQLVTIISVDNDEPQVFIEHRDNWINSLKDTIKQYQDENSSAVLL